MAAKFGRKAQHLHEKEKDFDIEQAYHKSTVQTPVKLPISNQHQLEEEEYKHEQLNPLLCSQQQQNEGEFASDTGTSHY